MKIAYRAGALAAAAVLSLSLAACSADNEPTSGSTTGGGATDGPTGLSGTLNGSGASSQESAMDAWRAAFQTSNADLTINYDPVGSGGGRTAFLEGAVSWAGSDSALAEEEYTTAEARCGADGAINLPVYISPIAVVFNLEGVTSLNLDAATISQIFDGKITTWNDPAIAALNEGVTLPDTAITPVHRSDDSGTTKNFTDYLNKASGGAWSYDADGVWPIDSGESGEGTSGLIDVVSGTPGTIGYADASKAGSLGVVAIQVGDTFNAPSAEGAALALSSSELASVNGDNDLAYKIDRSTTAAGAYPLMLLSYAIVCQAYEDATESANVTGFLSYVASAEGQQAAAAAAGSAPLPADLSAKIETILAEIAAA
ncbi:phosphate ABC transporter substrate-binding protein PstS [Demequina sp.]|uniref:phosphate ABC transporter substrate-binding protein PstS n=1 Tax=Demequina sp. TaxID=2050685 RepID=UPI003D0DD21C